MMLIGLTGKKRTGKDTAAQYLVENYNFVQYRMAGPLKEALKIIFRWDDDAIEVNKERVDPRWGISPRQAMQHIGTEWAQFDLGNAYPQYKETTGRELWSNRFDDWYQRHGKNRHVVVSDVRFPHEVQVIRDNGGILVKLERELDFEDNHASEAYIDKMKANITIQNTGTYNELYSNIKQVIGVYESVA